MTIWRFMVYAFRMAFSWPPAGISLLISISALVFYYLAIPLTYRAIFDDAIATRDMRMLGLLLLIQLGLLILFGAAGVTHD